MRAVTAGVVKLTIVYIRAVVAFKSFNFKTIIASTTLFYFQDHFHSKYAQPREVGFAFALFVMVTHGLMLNVAEIIVSGRAIYLFTAAQVVMRYKGIMVCVRYHGITSYLINFSYLLGG